MSYGNSTGVGSVARRPRNSSNRQIPPWSWNKYRREIEQHYIYADPPKSLNQLAEYMRDEHGFVATDKQFKAQLAKWNTKKNMTVSDAATILHLMNSADGENTKREVSFNGRIRTKDEISRYIAKSSKVVSEEDLLGYLPPASDWSEQIQCHDYHPDSVGPPPHMEYALPPQKAAHAPPNFDTETGSKSTSSYDLVSSISATYHDARPQSSEFSNTDFSAQGWSHDVMDIDPDAVRSPDSGIGTSLATASLHEPQQAQMRWADEDFLLPNDTSAGFEDLVGPMTFTTAADSFLKIDCGSDVNTGLEQLNRYISVTPETIESGYYQSSPSFDVELDAKIDYMLGKDNIRQATEADNLSWQFLRNCCKVSIYEGQRPDETLGNLATERASQATHAAAESYKAIVCSFPDHSLTVLNNMVYLLSMYGHMELATQILKYIAFSLQDFLDDQNATTISTIVRYTLAFMTSIAEPGTGSLPCYDLSSLRKAVELSSTISGSTRMVLASKYNYAWALLEMQQPQDAADILMNIKPDCEEVFGPHQIQTVVCVSTLARAHLYTGRTVAAESLIDEVMGPRIAKAFSRSHPLYWEFKNRQALFMRFLAKDRDDEEGASRREESERLLHKVLQWRVVNLGPNNPQTQRTFRVLRNFYIQSARFEDASSLSAVLVSSRVPESSDTSPSN